MWRLLSPLIGLATGVLLTLGYFFFVQGDGSRSDKHLGKTGFINPVLECSEPTSSGLRAYGMEKRLRSFSEKLVETYSRVSRVHLYYKDLGNGAVIGINEDEFIRGGSLLKVPLMIGFLKEAEADPNLLKKKVKVNLRERKDFYAIQGHVPPEFLQDGKKYSYEEIIRAAIINSDNVAATLLEDYKQNDLLKTIVKEMDIPISSKIAPYREMTLKDYAGFFRILYNATYLSKTYSNYALKLLSEVRFDDGLRRGVPAGIPISHKFGEKLDEQEHLYFNDCGIVYNPTKHYLLCISVKGDDKEEQLEVIRKLSEFVFREVSEVSK